MSRSPSHCPCFPVPRGPAPREERPAKVHENLACAVQAQARLSLRRRDLTQTHKVPQSGLLRPLCNFVPVRLNPADNEAIMTLKPGTHAKVLRPVHIHRRIVAFLLLNAGLFMMST